MHRGSYLETILNSIEDNINNDSKNVVFINNHSSFVLPKNIIEDNIVAHKGNYIIKEHTFRSDIMQGPYEPFMDWIREIYKEDFESELSIEEFLCECGIYNNQLEVFKTYIQSGHCVRKEDVILHEVDYEKNKFLISLLNIIRKLAEKKPLYLILNKLHLADSSTMQCLIKYLKCVIVL